MATNEFSVGNKFEAEVILLYVATCNSDTTEGKGHTVDDSYHLTEHAARIATAGIGMMGHDGDVEARLGLRLADGRYTLLPTTITISDNFEKEAMLRRRATNKLTSAELAALLGSKTE